MSMQVVVSDQIADWIATYGDSDAANVWQKCIDAGVLVTETIGFNVIVTWGKLERNAENAVGLDELINLGVLNNELLPVTKSGEVIRWIAA